MLTWLRLYSDNFVVLILIKNSSKKKKLFMDLLDIFLNITIIIGEKYKGRVKILLEICFGGEGFEEKHWWQLGSPYQIYHIYIKYAQTFKNDRLILFLYKFKKSQSHGCVNNNQTNGKGNYCNFIFGHLSLGEEEESICCQWLRKWKANERDKLQIG